jgi:hypothetical protein
MAENAPVTIANTSVTNDPVTTAPVANVPALSNEEKRRTSLDLPTKKDLVGAKVKGYGDFRDLPDFTTMPDNYIKQSEHAATITTCGFTRAHQLAFIETTVAFCLFTEMSQLTSALISMIDFKPNEIFVLTGAKFDPQYSYLPITFIDFEEIIGKLSSIQDNKIVISGHGKPSVHTQGAEISDCLVITSSEDFKNMLFVHELLRHIQPGNDITFVMCYSGLISEMAKYKIVIPPDVNVSFDSSKSTKSDFKGFKILIDDYKRRKGIYIESAKFGGNSKFSKKYRNKKYKRKTKRKKSKKI